MKALTEPLEELIGIAFEDILYQRCVFGGLKEAEIQSFVYAIFWERDRVSLCGVARERKRERERERALCVWGSWKKE